MFNVVVNTQVEANQDKFILSTGFASKDEMIAYLRDEHLSHLVLPFEYLSEVGQLFGKSNYISAYLEDDLILIDPSDICFIEAALRKSKIYTQKNVYLTNKPLLYYEKKLVQYGFFRSHKSFLINVKQVERCSQMISSGYDVQFKNTKQKAEISRNKMKAFKKIIEL